MVHTKHGAQKRERCLLFEHGSKLALQQACSGTQQVIHLHLRSPTALDELQLPSTGECQFKQDNCRGGPAQTVNCERCNVGANLLRLLLVLLPGGLPGRKSRLTVTMLRSNMLLIMVSRLDMAPAAEELGT